MKSSCSLVHLIWTCRQLQVNLSATCNTKSTCRNQVSLSSYSHFVDITEHNQVSLLASSVEDYRLFVMKH
eukprot:911444-Amphidinium_carterae.1